MRLFLVYVLCWGLTTVELWSQEYFRPPDMETEIFDASKLELDQFERAGVVGALVALATEFEGDDEISLELRSQTLAIAGRIDPESEKVAEALKNLLARGRAHGDVELTKARVQERLLYAAHKLVEAGPEGPKAGSYIADLSYRIDLDSKLATDARTLIDELHKKDLTADWSGVLGAPVAIESKSTDSLFNPGALFTKRKAFLPGGTAKEFAARQRTINALVVFSLPNGRMVGAASELTVTASPSGKSNSVEFEVNQEVGKDIQYSLEEVLSHMRLRHGQDGTTPKGQRVEIVFESKGSGGKVDGNSAGNAMALALEGLFTGLEIDPKYACTGAITASGKIQRIGGVIAKMRGAAQRKCTVMSIPHSNRKDITDIYLLDGIEAVTAIQVFAIQEFEESLALATTERSESLEKTLKDYDTVVKAIVEHGEEILKNKNTQNRLKQILEVHPTHCTARLLLNLAQEKASPTLSISGSIEVIDKKLGILTDKINDVVKDAMTGQDVDGDDLKKASKKCRIELIKLDELVDPETSTLLEAALKMAGTFKDIEGGPDFRGHFENFQEEAQAYHTERANIINNSELFD